MYIFLNIQKGIYKVIMTQVVAAFKFILRFLHDNLAIISFLWKTHKLGYRFLYNITFSEIKENSFKYVTHLKESATKQIMKLEIFTNRWKNGLADYVAVFTQDKTKQCCRDSTLGTENKNRTLYAKGAMAYFS